ncbi:hypothetical protein [Shimia sagamensis]|nr:hypothetical protein [Shimia sagamensis]
MEARILEGLKDPWRASKGGPLREVILTANKDWFAEAEESDVLFSEDEKRAKEEQFKAHAVKWLKARFEADVIHAHADHDEMACHVHAVIMPRHEKKSARRGTQQTLQPSSHPLLESYEDAQDDVGAFFEEIGLRRGAKGAEARREAMRANAKARLIAGETGAEPVLQDIPKRREHVPTPVWWQTEILRLQNEAEALVRDQAAASRSKTEANQKIEKAKSAERAAKQRESAALEREKDAASVLAVADAVSSGELQFEGADHDVKQVLTEPQTSEEAITQETLKARSPRAVRLLQSLQNSFAQMRVKSDKLAEEKLATEAKAVRASAKAIESLKDAILKVVPQAARKRVLAEFLRVGQSAKKVEEKLRKSHGGRDE